MQADGDMWLLPHTDDLQISASLCRAINALPLQCLVAAALCTIVPRLVVYVPRNSIPPDTYAPCMLVVMRSTGTAALL